MSEALSQFINELKSDRKISEYSEDKVKQGVILRVLKLLGWNPFDIDEVTPEYSVEGRRVDYALRVKRDDRFFIEVKKPAEDLEGHQDQLLDYSYREGVKLAALTNGLTWWFYLPTQEGNWRDRKFYTVDIQAQETSDIVQTLMNILSKDKVYGGEALKYAEEIFKGRRKKKQIDETLPEAWNKIISDPDTVLVDLLSGTTGKLCGYTPDNDSVATFLKSHRETLLITEPECGDASKKSHREKVGKARKSEGVAGGDKPKITRHRDNSIDNVTIKLLEERPRTLEELHEALKKQFPGREALLRTTKRRVTGYLQDKYGVKIHEDDNGVYSIKKV
jgi:hypothetical protein